jgi:HPt (histidine-containing phosphotransfer) domain-containing protein
MNGGDVPDVDDDFPLLDPDALARAEAALQRLSGQYLQWARTDMAALEANLARVPDDPTALKRMFTVAHDMKGQAGTFGYPLVTELGNRLCRAIEAGDAMGHVAELVAALRHAIDGQLVADGGEADN